MKRIVLISSACALLALPASAEDLLGGIIGGVQTNAKATAFDAAVESQAPGATVLTDQLSNKQKAQLFDYGVENAGTVGQAGSVVGGGSGGLGAAVGTQVQQPVYGQQPAVTYQQVQPVYGQQPTYSQPQPVTTYSQQPAVTTYQSATDAYGNPIPQPQPQATTPMVHDQPVVTDVYGNPVPAQQPQVTYSQPTPTYAPAPAPTYAPAPAPATTQTTQTGITYDPNSGSVSVGADTINAIGGIIGN